MIDLDSITHAGWRVHCSGLSRSSPSSGQAGFSSSGPFDAAPLAPAFGPLERRPAVQSDDTPPASPAATDEEVARMVERLTKPVYTFHINEKGGPNITVEGENRFAMEREVSLLADAGREAADLLARVARERDEWHHAAMVENDTNASTLRKLKAAERRAEAAENALAIANQGGLDLLYAIRKAIGWTDKHALSLLPDECARLKKAAARNAPIWPGKDFDHFEPGGFDGPTGAN